MARRSPVLRLERDERLVALIRSGNDRAFEVMFDRYQARLLSFCTSMLKSRQDAEDVLQEVFANAHKAMLADERKINLRPWLYRIARNRCLNHLRKPVAEGQDSMDIHPHQQGTSAAEHVHNREELRQLLDDVRHLPETQRTALLLREIDQLSYEEIGETMDATIPSVKSLLVRARIGLAESSQARALSCGEVRVQLAEAAEGIAKASGPVRKHTRRCEDCKEFRTQLRSDRKALAALLPVGPLALLKGSLVAKALGFGGQASGGAVASSGTVGAGGSVAAAGASAAAGGGAVASGGVATAGAVGTIATGSAAANGIGMIGGAIGTKAAAGMATAALLTGAAVEVVDRRSEPVAPVAQERVRESNATEAASERAYHRKLVATVDQGTTVVREAKPETQAPLVLAPGADPQPEQDVEPEPAPEAAATAEKTDKRDPNGEGMVEVPRDRPAEKATNPDPAHREPSTAQPPAANHPPAEREPEARAPVAERPPSGTAPEPTAHHEVSGKPVDPAPAEPSR